MMEPSMAPMLYSDGEARMQAASAGFAPDIVEAIAPFDYAHLGARPYLREVGKHFFELAFAIAAERGNEFQTVMALQHLVIAKDAAVRARNDP